MRTVKNIRKPIRRYERSIEVPLEQEATEETEQPVVYADITASPNHYPVIIKISDSAGELKTPQNIQKTGDSKKQ